MKRVDYVCGLDLGQTNDYTALAIIEIPEWVPDGHFAERINAPYVGWIAPQQLTEWQRAEIRERAATAPNDALLAVRHLQRFRLGTPYPLIAAEMRSLLGTAPLAACTALLVDATGVGAPVVDMLRQAGLRPIAVTITGGETAAPSPRGWNVPKRDLVAAVQVLLQTKRVRIAERLPDAATLLSELMAFQLKVTPAAHDTYGAWRDGAHDDLVLSVALAAWYSLRVLRSRVPATIVACRT